MTIATRLDESMRAAGFESQSELARRSGVPQPTIARILKGTGKKGPESETIKKLAHACKVSFEWLNEGIGKGPRGKVFSLIKKGHDDIKIPQFDVGGGMGRPTLLLDDQPGVIRNWDVDEPWIRHNVRHHTGLHNLCIVTGFGPSMQPLYNPGDPLLVDRGVKTVEIDGIFFFRIGDHGYIKWLQRIPKGTETILMATSENNRFVPFEIDKNMDFEVLGRVITVWKSSQY